MREYKEQVETVKRKVLIKTTCDLCGGIATHGEWESSSYMFDETEIEVTVRQKEGSSFPEGGSGTQYNVDMCPKCFKEKLVPWLESQRCSAKTEEWKF